MYPHANVQVGEPVEINPSVGHGYKIMPVSEWSHRWKRNDDFPDCLNCKSTNTKEHHFTQVQIPCWLEHGLANHSLLSHAMVRQHI